MGCHTVSIWLRWSAPGGKQPRHAAAYRNNRKNDLLAFNAIVNGSLNFILTVSTSCATNSTANVSDWRRAGSGITASL
jgi:hypothetical protein